MLLYLRRILLVVFDFWIIRPIEILVIFHYLRILHIWHNVGDLGARIGRRVVFHEQVVILLSLLLHVFHHEGWAQVLLLLVLCMASSLGRRLKHIIVSLVFSNGRVNGGHKSGLGVMEALVQHVDFRLWVMDTKLRLVFLKSELSCSLTCSRGRWRFHQIWIISVNTTRRRILHVGYI